MEDDRTVGDVDTVTCDCADFPSGGVVFNVKIGLETAEPRGSSVGDSTDCAADAFPKREKAKLTVKPIPEIHRHTFIGFIIVHLLIFVQRYTGSVANRGWSHHQLLPFRQIAVLIGVIVVT